MEDLFYNVTDIQHALKISKTKAYDFVKETYEKQSPFQVVHIGSAVRIPKKSFHEWLSSVGAIGKQ